jgi:hypothetical protein
MSFFLFDIETCGVESNCVVLSAAIVYFDYEKDFNKTTYDELVKRCCYVKFDVKQQVKKGRTIDESTMEWWKKQGDVVKKLTLHPSEDDASVEVGLDILRNYIKANKKDGLSIWIRGSLDQCCIDSLAKDFGVEPIANYNVYRDVRTAISFLTDKDVNGYCKVEAPEGLFNKSSVIKHLPYHDICYDAFMMVYPEK